MKSRVLFVCYGGGHVRMVLALVRELERRQAVEPLILGLTTARAEVEAAGYRCLGVADFVQPGDGAAIAQGERMARALSVLATDLRESAAYLGLGFADLVQSHGAEEADRLYAAHGRQVFLPVPTLTRIVQALGADAVVATSAPRAERAALLAARACGVPSLCMVDLFAAYEIAWLRAPDFADRICVLNERVRQRLVDAGRPAAHIAVTGNPAFDRLGDAQVRERGRQLRAERGWNDRHVVLWASQVEPERHPVRPERGNVELPVRIAGTLRALLSAHPEMVLVVRPHPSEPADDAPLQPGEWRSPRGEDLHVLLHAADVVVVMTSTVGIEARLAGKVVIQVLGSLYSDDAPYVAYGIADEAVSLDALPDAIERARGRRTALPGALDQGGQAAALVADQLQQLLPP